MVPWCSLQQQLRKRYLQWAVSSSLGLALKKQTELGYRSRSLCFFAIFKLTSHLFCCSRDPASQ